MRLPLWEKDKSPPPGTSFFTVDRAERPRTAPSFVAANPFRKLSQDASVCSPSASSSATTPAPLLSLRLSSISFLDSVVHDGISENPLYVIETVANSTKIRRSDPRGFVNVARVRWREDPNYFSRNKKELNGVLIAFGRGQWKPADELLGFSFSSLSSSSYKFYVPHHPHSLRWKRVGSFYHCNTQSVKGPVAILEPSVALSPPKLKIFDPIFSHDSGRLQRTHAGIPISLLDFLLVTSMLILTETNEWKNITRFAPDDQVTTSAPSVVSSHQSAVDGLPSTSPSDFTPPLTSTPSRANTLGHGPKRSPSSLSLVSGTSGRGQSAGIERWRNSIRPDTPDEASRRPSSSSNGRTSPAPVSRRSSGDFDGVSTPASPHVHRFSFRSSSSHSHRTPYTSNNGRELPIPPVPSLPNLAQSHFTYANPPVPSPAPTSMQFFDRSPSPTQSQQSGSGMPVDVHAHEAVAASTHVWEPQSSAPITPVTPSFTGISTRVYAPSSSGSSTPYPMTPSRALPPVPMPPPLPQAIDRATSKSPLPSPGLNSSSSPSPSSQTYPRSRANSQSHMRRSTLKAPPNYAASTQTTELPQSSLPDHEFSDAVQELSISGAGNAALAGIDGRQRPDSLYDAPPPAYDQHNFDHSSFHGLAMGVETVQPITMATAYSVSL